MFWSSKTLYLGNSLSEANRIRDILAAEKMKYKRKVVDHSNEWTGHNTVRGMGGNNFVKEADRIQYEILVKQKDYEKAVYLIRKQNER